MPRKRYRPEDILSKLREADILNSQGRIVVETIRVLCISDVTCYRWCKEYGGMKTYQVKRCSDHKLYRYINLPHLSQSVV